MPFSVEEIMKEALAMPSSTRALIAETLLESLDHQEDFDISPEWQAEIQRRCQDIDAGNAELIDADEVFKELESRYQ